VACGTSDTFVSSELQRKESGQLGPKYVISRGRLPDGHPWLLTAYRRARGQICFGQAWRVKDGGSYEGKCTSDDKAREAIESQVTYPVRGDEPLYMMGIIIDTEHARYLHARRGDATQDFRLIRNTHFPRDAFYIGLIKVTPVPETVELIDASGAVIQSMPFRS